jgi:hypothetical protein
MGYEFHRKSAQKKTTRQTLGNFFKKYKIFAMEAPRKQFAETRIFALVSSFVRSDVALVVCSYLTLEEQLRACIANLHRTTTTRQGERKPCRLLRHDGYVYVFRRLDFHYYTIDFRVPVSTYVQSEGFRRDGACRTMYVSDTDLVNFLRDDFERFFCTSTCCWGTHMPAFRDVLRTYI